MPPPNSRLNNFNTGKSLDLAGSVLSLVLRLGLSRVPKCGPLVPTPSEQFAVVSDGEGVSAAGDDGANTVGLEGFDEADPFFLFVASDS